MRYIIGVILFLSFCYFSFLMYKKFAKEANRAILREVKKNNYPSYKEYIKDMQKKEDLLIKKKRKMKKLKKYQKKYGISQ